MDQLRKIDNCGYFVRNKNLQQLSALFTWEKSGFVFFGEVEGRVAFVKLKQIEIFVKPNCDQKVRFQRHLQRCHVDIYKNVAEEDQATIKPNYQNSCTSKQ